MTKFEEYIIDKFIDVGKLCPDDLNIDCYLCDEVSTYPCKECWEIARKIIEEGEQYE